MVRENVAIIGTGRTGTTLLFSLIKQIPPIVITEPKEFLNNFRLTELAEIMCATKAEQSIVFTHVKTAPGKWFDHKVELNGESKTINEIVEILKSV